MAACGHFEFEYELKFYQGQESIQSSSLPDPKHTLGKDENTKTQESQEVSPFPAGDHKIARNRQDSITTIKMYDK